MSLVKDGVFNHLSWRNSSLSFLDQTALPNTENFIDTSDYKVVCKAIARLSIRGAPAIGVAGGYGLALGALAVDNDQFPVFLQKLDKIGEEIKSVRPTAVNLSWAVDRILSSVQKTKTAKLALRIAIKEAKTIHSEDIAMCKKLSQIGADLLPDNGFVMTHCNAGGLATGGYGTALGVIHSANSNGKQFEVVVNETRPLLQGARLTAWELKQLGIPFILITDNMSAYMFFKKDIACVIVGADRIAMNGDTANKIGTYNLAVLAQYHKIPFYVAAPTSTVDPATETGLDIPVEVRKSKEVTDWKGQRVAPRSIRVFNPAFDITPAHLITAIITENGIIKSPFRDGFEHIL